MRLLGPANVIYSDTDSIFMFLRALHLIKEYMATAADELGKFKVEKHDGQPFVTKECVFVNKKTYAAVIGDSVMFKAKGVNWFYGRDATN